MNDGERPLEYREATTCRGNQVTVESVGHTEVTDKRYRLTFFNFDMAREWANKLIRRYEANNRRIQLVVYREWEGGPDGRELLGKYETKDTH